MKMTKYKLTLSGLSTPEGSISALALKEFLDALLTSAERGLRLAVSGESVKRATKPGWLQDSLDFVVTGLENGSTVINIEAPALGDTAPEQIVDQDLWYTKPEPDDTALTVLYRSVSALLRGDMESDKYDPGVLKGILSFKKLIGSVAKGVEVSCLSRVDEVFFLGESEIERIESIKKATSDPQVFVVSGILDTIQHSKQGFRLRLSNGAEIRGKIDEEFMEATSLREFWGKEVTVKGKVHFHSSGNVRFIHAQLIRARAEGEELFGKMPLPSQLVFFDSEYKTAAKRIPMQEIWGAWPGDESIEQLLEALRG